MVESGADLKLYGRVFFATAIPFGVCVAVLFAIVGLLSGSGELAVFGITAALGAGLVFGLCMTLVLATAHIIGVRKAGGPTSGARYARELLVEMSVEQTFETSLQALELLNATIVSRTELPWQLEAQTRATWRSFGEVVCVTCEPVTPSQTKVSLTSVPRVPTTLVDYGKGLENINHLANFLVARSDAPA